MRWMYSFDTTEDDIRKFAAVVAEAGKGCRRLLGRAVTDCFLPRY